MNRRKFLMSVGAVPAIVAVPAVAAYEGEKYMFYDDFGGFGRLPTVPDVNPAWSIASEFIWVYTETGLPLDTVMIVNGQEFRIDRVEHRVLVVDPIQRRYTYRLSRLYDGK